MIVTLGLLRIMYKGWYEEWRRRMKHTKTVEEISVDFPLMVKSVAAFILTIILFLLEDAIGYPPAIPAVIGTGLLLAIAGREVSIHEAQGVLSGLL